MIKNLLFSTVLLFFSFVSTAQDKITETLIQHSIVKLFDGISKLDDDLMRAQITDDYLLIEDGKVWTMDSLINVLKPLKKVEYKRVNKINFLRTEYQGDMAWVYYDNSADIMANNKPRAAHWLESAVLVKQRGEWKIKFMHVTRLKQ
ncbi:MAG TPA: nuclear transport factor 2 family protein [Cyclobacteriaceae bacterium]|nr:nuclear transport factor 2 family protein [Cyclobacteriaceae bacterium]